MLVIAKGLSNALDFDAKDLDSYELEVIGGNHRREVISRIIAASPDAKTKELYKFVYVQIYAGELFIDCAHTLEHSGNRMSIKLVVWPENLNTHANVILSACSVMPVPCKNRNENNVYLFSHQ